MPRNEPTEVKYRTPDGFNKLDFDATLSKIKELCEARDLAERRVTELRQSIERLWGELPPMIEEIPFRRCTFKSIRGNTCDKPTQDRLGTRAMCANHATDEQRALWEALMYAKD